jgi:phage gp36-like protein
MSYADPSQIQSEFKDVTFDADSAVTDTEVTRFLEEADAEIDINLCGLYETPITGTTALVVVRMISIWLVKDRVSEILLVKTGRPENDQDGGSRPGERAREMLKNLAKGTLQLKDATPANPYAVRSYTAQNSVEFVFDADKVQW